MPHQSAMEMLEGHLLPSICAQVLLYTRFPSSPSPVSRWQRLTAARKRQVGPLAPLLAVLHSILNPPSLTFTQEQFVFFQEENWACGLGQPELILKGLLALGGVEP